MNSWQLIDTAPKDGTRVLIYTPDTHSNMIVVARYCTIDELWEEWGDYYPCEPTHWQPLPDPPQLDSTPQSDNVTA